MGALSGTVSTTSTVLPSFRYRRDLESTRSCLAKGDKRDIDLRKKPLFGSGHVPFRDQVRTVRQVQMQIPLAHPPLAHLKTNVRRCQKWPCYLCGLDLGATLVSIT